MPKEVTTRATEILARLEEERRGHLEDTINATTTTTTRSFSTHNAVPLDVEEEKAITIQVLAEVRRCKTKELSPQEALALVQKLKALAD